MAPLETALAAATHDELRAFWSDQLGVDEAAFDRGGVTVGAGPEAGVELLVRGDARLVGAPERLVGALRDRAADLAVLGVGDATEVRELVADALQAGVGTGAEVATVHGPAFYGYADADTFEPVDGASEPTADVGSADVSETSTGRATTRPLTQDDRGAYERFRESVPDAEWSAGGPAFDPGRTVGRVVDGEVVAAAGYEVWAGRLAHVGVVTRPDARNEGHGRAVVSRVTADALDAGLLPQYRTLEGWPQSVALAEGLGYERFGTSLSVELD
jgi:GNAT superfamily N-acetyltransferase